MKFPQIQTVLLVAGLLAASQSYAQPAPAASSPQGPEMVFPTNEYNFGKVNMGQQVNHVYVVSNAGDATLIISNVAPGCHCTTARPWTREVAAGQTGEIPIKFDSSGFHGDITRTITVTSNGKKAPIQTLYLRGSIWREIEVNPQTAYMNVSPDSDTPATTTVHIVNQAETSVTLSEPTSVSPAFTATLKTNIPGKDFDVMISTKPPLAAGNNVGTISIKTSSTNVPVLTITALAMVQPSIGVAPMQIVLPPDMGVAVTNLITITANGKRSLTVSNLNVCCDTNIQVTLQEIIPGRVFHVTSVFPPNFKVATGQRYQISVKSNMPDHPEIVVPITQFNRPPPTAPQMARPRAMNQAPLPPPAPISIHP
jgi:hypothetical protein